jgi:hypothetical protein
MNRRGSLAQGTSDPNDRLASLISTPEFFALDTCDDRGPHFEHLPG